MHYRSEAFFCLAQRHRQGLICNHISFIVHRCVY